MHYTMLTTVPQYVQMTIDSIATPTVSTRSLLEKWIDITASLC